MYIRNPNTTQPLESEHGEIVYELIGKATGGTTTYSLAQIVIPPGKASRLHAHPIAEESYYILSGTGHMALNGETAILKAGDAVAILPEQIHQISNQGEDDLVLLAVCVPAWTPDNSDYLD